MTIASSVSLIILRIIYFAIIHCVHIPVLHTSFQQYVIVHKPNFIILSSKRIVIHMHMHTDDVSTLRLLILSDVVWCDMDSICLVKQFLQPLYDSIISRHGVEGHHGNQPNKSMLVLYKPLL